MCKIKKDKCNNCKSYPSKKRVKNEKAFTTSPWHVSNNK